jgi:nitrogen fixation NifU-like protein
MESYSEIVMDHAKNPRNVGILDPADARGVQMNPVCGDTLMLTLKIDDGRITESRIQTKGCAASVATSSILTELIQGMTLDEAMDLSHEEVSEAVGGLPASKLHSAALVIDALRRAITGYRETQMAAASH